MSEQAKNKLSVSMEGNNNKTNLIQVLDMNTGLTNVYKGYAETYFHTGVSHQTVRKYLGDLDENYILKIVLSET